MSIESFIQSKNIRLDQQLRFTAEIDKMTSILRRTMLIDGSRRENDAEHSWHIAVLALIFAEYTNEPVDVSRSVKMCVVHDLIEIYAGDIPRLSTCVASLYIFTLLNISFTSSTESLPDIRLHLFHYTLYRITFQKLFSKKDIDL